MSVQNRLPRGTTMSAREFNQNTSKAKTAAKHGPVFITDRGKPSYVLLSREDYERLNATPRTILQALADPQAAPDDLDLMDFIPEREAEPTRFSFGDDE